MKLFSFHLTIHGLRSRAILHNQSVFYLLSWLHFCTQSTQSPSEIARNKNVQTFWYFVKRRLVTMYKRHDITSEKT
jgi:hypothetical protein